MEHIQVFKILYISRRQSQDYILSNTKKILSDVAEQHEDFPILLDICFQFLKNKPAKHILKSKRNSTENRNKKE